MRVSRIIACITVIVMGLVGSVAVHADVLWKVNEGTTVVSLDGQRLDALNVTVDYLDAAGGSQSVVQAGLAIDASSTLTIPERDGILNGAIQGRIRHVEGFAFRTPSGESILDGFVVRAVTDGEDTHFVVGDGAAVLELRDLKMGFDRVAQTFLMEGAELVATELLAEQLGAPALSGQVIGSFAIRSTMEWSAGDEPLQGIDGAGDDPTILGGTECGRPGGPDVIVGLLPDVSNYASMDGIEAYAIGTTSCNVGDTVLLWIAGDNRHPVIAQNMYRLKNDRFEHIGMSWLKHGFTALALNDCACGCIPPGTGTRLGIGCSDPYSSGLNGSQSNLGPRSEVNAHTGFFLYPFGWQGVTGPSIYKRLQVHISDLDPAQDGGGLYFVEGQYVTQDDAAAGNQDNNASYRRIGISGAGTSWTASFSGMPATQREQAGIRAWQDNDPTVVETDVRVPGEGLVLLAAKATDLGRGGMWHYEYAVQNLNSDRSIGSFSVPVPAGATVENVGFHDVDYHSGEPYPLTNWPGVHSGGAVTWATETFATNPNANAIRWGTLYNFRFDADAPPADGEVTLGIFKPGGTGSVNAVTRVPAGCSSTAACPEADVNCDNIADGFDIAVIRNPGNWLLATVDADEPRADVNGDGLVDGFDISVVRRPECWLH